MRIKHALAALVLVAVPVPAFAQMWDCVLSKVCQNGTCEDPPRGNTAFSMELTPETELNLRSSYGTMTMQFTGNDDTGAMTFYGEFDGFTEDATLITHETGAVLVLLETGNDLQGLQKSICTNAS